MTDRCQAPTTDQPTVEAAVSSVERGWTMVFPLDQRGNYRKSKAKGGPGSWKETTATTPHDVRRIYTEEDVHPKVVAVQVGPASGFIALDWDGPEGIETRARWEEDHGPLPTTLSSRTGSGGRHDLFRYLSVMGRANANGLDEGLDVKEGTEGASFIYIPPTDRTALKKSHTQPYAWEDPESALADLPEAWTEALQEEDQEERAERFHLPERIPDGARNETLYRYGCQLRSQGADRKRILECLLEVNEEHCEPPLAPEEVEGSAESAANHARGRAIGRIQRVKTSPISYRLSFAAQWVDIPDTATLLDPNRVQALAADQVGLIPTPPIGWGKWKNLVDERLAEAEEIVPEGEDPEPPRVYTLPELGEEAEPVEKVTPHLAYRDLVNTLYGGGKESGKSTLISTDISFALGAGLRVLWMSEMPRAVSNNYLRRIRAAKGLPHPEEVGIISFRENPPRSWQEAEDLILGFGAKVIYVDTLVAAVRAFLGEVPDHADNAAWHSLYTRWFGRWATIGEGQAVVVAHHTRKADNELIGSVGIRDGSDFLTLMEPATRDQNVRRLTTRGRLPPEEDQERYLRFNPESNLYAPADFQGEQGDNAPPEDRLETAVLRFVRDHPGSRARALYEGVDHREKDVKEARDELLGMGLIKNESDNRGHSYQLGMSYEKAVQFLEAEHASINQPQKAGAIF